MIGGGTGSLKFPSYPTANTPPPTNATIITKTVTVPVPQEKIVTRVVYVERNRNRSRNSRIDLNVSEPRNNVAKSEAETPDSGAISLIGFKPTEQVKLKIMKGSYRDER